MANTILNSSLGAVAISKEDNSNMGIPSKDFTNPATKAFYIDQDFESPLNPNEDYEKTVKKTTRGTQVQHAKDVIRGREVVTLNYTDNISKTSFATSIMPMFFPHSYKKIMTITDPTITAVSNDGDVVTITVTDAGTIADGDVVIISGRTVTAENDSYVISNLSSNSFDIDYVGGFDTEIAGEAKAALNLDESIVEDTSDCNKHRRESSFTMYQPILWDKDTCTVGKGKIITGLAPKSLNLNFVDSTASVDMIGREVINDSENLPSSDSQYNSPNYETGTYYGMNNPTLKDADGVVQECLSLELTMTNGLDDTQKVYKANKFSRVTIDGLDITGSLSMLFLDDDETDNKSYSIYKKRMETLNGGIYSFGCSAQDGSYFEITGNVNFRNIQANPASNGWELTADFDVLYGEDKANITAKCLNGYSISLAELFATTA